MQDKFKKLKASKILKLSKKLKSINYLGGKCEICGENRMFRLTFHHLEPSIKEEIINIRVNNRWSLLKEELDKCQLLCNNCHQELHFLKTKVNNKRNENNKKLFIEYKNSQGCKNCGYNKCNASLHFHHLYDKKFRISTVPVEFKSLDNIKIEVLDELDKCILLCANCHQELHSDLKFFEENKINIYKKIESYNEKQKKLDRNLVKKMYFEDEERQIDIAKYFNCSKSSICKIIKELKNL